jgi:hypothetical protein
MRPPAAPVVKLRARDLYVHMPAPTTPAGA